MEKVNLLSSVEINITSSTIDGDSESWALDLPLNLVNYKELFVVLKSGSIFTASATNGTYDYSAYGHARISINDTSFKSIGVMTKTSKEAAKSLELNITKDEIMEHLLMHSSVEIYSSEDFADSVDNSGMTIEFVSALNENNLSSSRFKLQNGGKLPIYVTCCNRRNSSTSSNYGQSSINATVELYGIKWR